MYHYCPWNAIIWPICCCNLDPDPDSWSRCRFWSGWTQIYRTYCNVRLLGLICPKMTLLGLFCCNLDPDPDFCFRCRSWSRWTQIYLTYCNVPLLSLICPKMALFGLFWCNPDPDPDLWTRCRLIRMDPDILLNLITVMYHYWAFTWLFYFCVICGSGSGSRSGLCSKIKKWLLDVPKNMHAKFGVDWCSGVSPIDETKVWRKERRQEGRKDAQRPCRSPPF